MVAAACPRYHAVPILQNTITTPRTITITPPPQNWIVGCVVNAIISAACPSHHTAHVYSETRFAPCSKAAPPRASRNVINDIINAMVAATCPRNDTILSIKFARPAPRTGSLNPCLPHRIEHFVSHKIAIQPYGGIKAWRPEPKTFEHRSHNDYGYQANGNPISKMTTASVHGKHFLSSFWRLFII